jgi:dihydrofolate reductase
VLGGDVVEEVAKLRQRRAGDIVIHGSAQLVQTLVEHDLIDKVGVQSREVFAVIGQPA